MRSLGFFDVQSSAVADNKFLVFCIVAYVGRHPGTCMLQHSSQCGLS